MIKDRKAFIQLTTVSISGSSTEPDVSPKNEKETWRPPWGSLLDGLPRVCFEDPAGAVTRWLSHGVLGCMERPCFSCPRGILLPPCVFVGLLG